MEKTTRTPSIYLCILLDLIGYATFSIPGIGEFGDVIWAPLSGFIFLKLFGGPMGKIGGAFSFLEEILPFTDIVPTFTIAWLIRNSQAVRAERKAYRINLSAKQGLK